MTTDKIHIRDLTLDCIIGDLEEERHHKQKVVINIALYTSLAAAARTDDLKDAVDYAELKSRIQAAVEVSSFKLIESLAESVARLCLEDVRVERVHVVLDKPGAMPCVRGTAVEIERSRDGRP